MRFQSPRPLTQPLAAKSGERSPGPFSATQAMGKFHSECDVAALVYGPKDDPDVLLLTFARRLIAEGYDALGVVQRRGDIDDEAPGPAKFVLLPDEAGHDDDCRCEAPGGVDGAIDLDDVAARLASELRRRPDLLDPQPIRVDGGRGQPGCSTYCPSRSNSTSPWSSPFPRRFSGRWLILANGLAVRLKPNLDALGRWWRALRRIRPGGATGVRFARCSSDFWIAGRFEFPGAG